MKGKISKITTDVINIIFGVGKIPKIGTIIETSSKAILSVESILSDTTVTAVVIKQISPMKIGEIAKSTGMPLQAPVGKDILGRMFNVLGEPIDNKPISSKQIFKDVSIVNKVNKGFYTKNEVFETGIKAIDFFVPILKGDKIGFFGGAGVGKTLIVKELINNVALAKKDSNNYASIVAGIGERSREGEELYNELKSSKLLNNVTLFFAQMNEFPGARMKVIYPALTAAEYFRDKMKKNVLIFIDNIYRFVQAGSELSSSLNKMPSQSGYQPTLMTEIANVQERLSNSPKGTITSFETIYIPADDMSDPAAVAVFSHIDGSLVLDRKIAASGRYPAIDPLSSSSNNINEDFIGLKHVQSIIKVKNHLQRYADLEDMLSIMGQDSISKEDLLVINRARKLQNFFTQNFQTAEEFTQKPGQFVSINKTIESIERILDGEFDEYEPEDFLYIGTVDDIPKKIVEKEIKLSKKELKLKEKQEKKLKKK